MRIEFVVPRGYPAKLLEAVEKVLYRVALGISSGARHLRRGGIMVQVPRAASAATSGSEAYLVADQSAAGVSCHVQLAGQPAAAAAQGLRPIFLRAPAACRLARTVVESTSSMCQASSCCTAASTQAHTRDCA